MTWIALAYHLASRLAYVLYVGVTLKRQDRAAYLTRRHGPEAAFRAVASAAARARRQVCTWFRPPSFARYSARSAALTT